MRPETNVGFPKKPDSRKLRKSMGFKGNVGNVGFLSTVETDQYQLVLLCQSWSFREQYW